MGAGIHAALKRAAQGCGVALGVSIPVSVALDSILLGVIALLWLGSGAWREKLDAIRANPVALAAAALFLALLLGTLYGEHHAGDAGSYLVKYADLLFIPVFVTLFREPARRWQAIMAIALGLGLVLALALLIAAGLPAWRPGLGTLGHPVVFKHYLTHSILMAFAAFAFLQLARAAPSPRARALWGAAAAAAAVNVLMVPGRSGYVILAALATYAGYATWRWRGLALGGAAVAATFALLAVVPGTFQERLGLARGAPQTLAGQWARASSAERLEMYATTAAIIRDHPLLGVGTGGFPKAYSQRVPPDAVAPASRNPHNEYLLIAAQIGLPGLGLLLALFGLHWRLAARLATPLETHLARGLLLSLAVGCLFNSLLLDHTEGLLFAWLTGVLFAGLRPRQA